MNKLNWAAGLLLIFLCFGIIVYGKDPPGNSGMVIFAPLELTEREPYLLSLAQVSNNALFEYEVDDTIHTVMFELQELKGGE